MAWMIVFYVFCVLMIGFELFYIIFRQYKDFKEGLKDTDRLNYYSRIDREKKINK